MNQILEGLMTALKLLVSFDGEVYGTILRSICVSGMAVVIASGIQMPIGIYLAHKPFKGKKVFSRLLYASMSVPSVVVGLLVLLLLSRQGIFGFAQLLYTPTAMVIAQSLLISPLILGLTYNMVKQRGGVIVIEGKLLGATPAQCIPLLARELNTDLGMIVVTGFSRAISEVGAVMLVGGNIKGQTRVMTTTIALMNGRGDYAMAIALGIVLLLISLVVNGLIYKE